MSFFENWKYDTKVYDTKSVTGKKYIALINSHIEVRTNIFNSDRVPQYKILSTVVHWLNGMRSVKTHAPETLLYLNVAKLIC